MEQKYDILIVGSGLGGLLCGAILSKNGFNVCILEKNPKVGGCLDSYSKDGAVFDTGVHYLGGLEKGQNLYMIFNYLGIIDKLGLVRLDMDKFDVFSFADDPKQYAFAQTYPLFIETLAKDFPHERKGIEKYCQIIRDLCRRFPLYNLENGDFMSKLDLISTNARDVINSCVNDPFLQQILAGNNNLYAGVAEKTPFYIHALIINSYIESAWKCKGYKIARSLVDLIKSNGGTIINNAEVCKIKTENGLASEAVTCDGRSFRGKHFISDIHPAVTISITETDVFRKAYINRINSIENTMGAFVLNVVFKENKFPHLNYNYYNFSEKDVWQGVDYKPEKWPDGYVLFTNTNDKKFAESATILAYLRYSELSKWHSTFNTAFKPASRGADYEEFKEQKARKLMQFVEKKNPGFNDAIKSYHTATPLTFRDYYGSPEGSLYGILRDYREPLKTFIPSRTKVANLLFTGQNLNVHGVLGVSVSSIVTCGELLGIDFLLEKIKNARQ